jgi:Protein of unknown function (DUF1552)
MNPLRKRSLGRRAMLRGMLGGAAVSIVLPPLEAMFDANGVAHADGSPLPKRLGIFFWGNGVKRDRFFPKETGAGFTLSEELAPLAPVRDYVSVVSGMSIKTGNSLGHHAGCVGILSGAPLVTTPHPMYSAPTIDQVLASTVGFQTRFPSIEVGVSRRVGVGDGTTLTYLSHSGPDQPNPPEYDPRKLFARIFGGDFVAPDSNAPPVVDPTRALRRSVLDVVSADLRALQDRVGATDRQRLEQHLDHVRSLESRLQGLAPAPLAAMCKAPAAPTAITEPRNGEPLEARTRAMSDLLAMALACDQARAFSMLFTGGVGYAVFSEVGATMSQHQLTHDEPGAQPLVSAAVAFTMQQLAYLLSALAAVPEGDGNVLDHCAILGTTDVSEGHDHSIENFPILVMGGGTGFLKHPGVHHSAQGENTSTVLLSLLRAAGLPLTEFGQDGGRVTSSCSAIEA